MPGSVARVAVRTLGCKVNRAESEAIAGAIVAAGVCVVAPDTEADVVVVNTCTVTGEADAKARKEVRRALDAPGRPAVVVTGCLAAMGPHELADMGERVIVEADKSRVVGRVLALVAGAGRDRRTSTAAGARAPGVFRTRVDVKVQDGCDHRCAYCIVPDARGAPASVPLRDVIARVAALADSGVREVVLTGINLGRYADGVADLTELVAQVAATGIARVRLSSIEPLDLTDRLVTMLAATPAVMPHLHVPLQSGSDRILASMRRGYDSAAYAALVARARAAMPGLAVTTDVIAGFPGETEADHRTSLEFAGACGFARMHVFRYSLRKGTPAAAMACQVAPATRAARAGELRGLGAAMESGRAAGRVGEVADVLVERVEGQVAVGTSEDHLRVTFGAALARAGDVVRVVLTGWGAGGMRGEPLV